MKEKKYKIISLITFITTIIFFASLIIFGLLAVKYRRDDGEVTNYEMSQFDYDIYLKNGEEYKKQDNYTFAASNIDNIDFYYVYKNNFDYTKYSLSMDFAVYVKPYTTINKSEYALIDTPQHLVVDKKVDKDYSVLSCNIDYQTYVAKLINFIADNGLNDQSIGKIEITLFALNLNDNSTSKSRIAISLGEEVVKFEELEKIYNTNQVKPLKIYNISLIAMVMSIPLIIISLIVFLFSFKLSRLNDYDRKAYLIFKFNKAILVSGDLKNKDMSNFIKVDSFNELLKVQNNVSLPVVYYKENEMIKFLIAVNDKGYYYCLTKEEVNKNN